MKIRSYGLSDWETVREIYDLSKPDEMSGSVDLRAILPLGEDPAHLALFDESTILVIEDAGRVVGFGGYRGNYISWLYVHPAHRRKGVARMLVQEMRERLSGTITLNVGRNNSAARRLYETFGFIVDREFTGKFNGHDVRVMRMKHERAG